MVQLEMIGQLKMTATTWSILRYAIFFIVILLFILIHKAGKNGKKLKDISKLNKIIDCPACHGKMSIDADKCPNCGKTSTLMELKKTQKKTDAVIIVMLLITLIVISTTMVLLKKTSERRKELEQEINQITSSNIDFAIYTLKDLEKNGIFDSLENLGGRELLEELEECDDKERIYEIVFLGAGVFFAITILSYLIANGVNSSKRKKYLSSIMTTPPQINGDASIKMEMPQAMKCLNCGNTLNPGAVFCPRCGNKIS